MLSLETELILRDFLLTVGDSEKILEDHRQNLCSIRDMAPRSLFQRIDRDQDGRVTSEELLSFLKSNQVWTFSLTDCEQLVQYFDCDEDGVLGEAE